MAKMATFDFFVRVLVIMLAAALLGAVDATAVPAKRVKVKRDVWDPPVTDPTEGTVWRVGDTVQVTWCVFALMPIISLSLAGVSCFSCTPFNHFLLDIPLCFSLA